jgi:hypothetical protein
MGRTCKPCLYYFGAQDIGRQHLARSSCFKMRYPFCVQDMSHSTKKMLHVGFGTIDM